MFYEIDPDLLKDKHLRGYTRWYRESRADIDLFVWQDEEHRILKFQLWDEDRLWEWERKKGWKFGSLDPESGAFKNYQSPVYHYEKHWADTGLRKILDLLEVSDTERVLQFVTSRVRQVLDKKNRPADSD